MKNFNHLVKGLDPVADAFSGTVYSDIVSMSGHNHIQFVIYKGVGTTGTSTVTVQACDDVSASNTSALPFHYQAITSGDTQGTYTAVENTGFVTTAGSSQLYKIDVDAQALAASGYEFIRLKMVQVADDPVLGGILIILDEPRDNQPNDASVIA
jgi:hypothetical protein